MNGPKIISIALLAALCSTAGAQTTGKTRAEVKAETAAAARAGELARPGDPATTLRQQYPERYDAERSRAVKAGKRRAKAVLQTNARAGH